MTENQQDSLSFSSRRSFVGGLIALAVVVCAACLFRIGALHGAGAVAILLLPILVGLWIIFARNLWWTILPVACSFGGILYFGFRINTHELALVLAILALLPLIVAPHARTRQRPPAPLSIYILLAYVTVHLCVSWYICHRSGAGGMGNVLRVYAYSLWPLVFAILFFKHGTTTHIKYVLIVMYLACLARVVLGLLAYLNPQTLFYVPLVNYIPSGSLTAGMDLRASTLLLITLSLCHVSISKSPVARLFHLAMLVPSAYLLLLGGGRISLVAFCGTIMLWALMQRRFLLLGATVVSVLALAIALNQDSSLLYRINDQRVQRVLSSLVLQTPTNDLHQKLVTGSDEWHYELMRLGLKRWTASPLTLATGNPVDHYDESFAGAWASQRNRADIATRMGSYESGLWTVLAITGAVGAILYVLAFVNLLKGMLPDLWRRGVRDHAGVFAFLAVCSTFLWLGLCWIYGHFPSQELMWAVIAKVAYYDMRGSPEPPAPQVPESATDIS